MTLQEDKTNNNNRIKDLQDIVITMGEPGSEDTPRFQENEKT